MFERTCIVCGNSFQAIRRNLKFCCDDCRKVGEKWRKEQADPVKIREAANRRYAMKRKKYYCRDCGTLLSHGRQKICLNCLLESVLIPEKSKKAKHLLYNRGYDIDMIKEELSWR